MVTKDWLESMLTSYYLFIECTLVDPDVQVRTKYNISQFQLFSLWYKLVGRGRYFKAPDH